MRVWCLGSSAVVASSTIQPRAIKSSIAPRWTCCRGDLRFLDYNLVGSSAAFLRSFGFTPSRNGKELPCADCRGRGYLYCKECDLGSPCSSCVECAGKGIMKCQQCQGDRVVRGRSVYMHEEFWEKLHSVSSITVKDDEAIENMSIPAAVATKRVYGPVTAATRTKISHALKDFERRTGSISSRMRKLHEDPVLHAERVAAIQKAKGTDESRKNISTKLIAYFTNPENRIKQSLRMKGVKYYCRACGEEGHRKSFCPSSTEPPRPSRAESRCSECGIVGHRANSCPRSDRRHIGRAPYKCTNCNGTDHNARTCPQILDKSSANKCSICKTYGHNRRTCPERSSMIQETRDGGSETEDL
ncbi:uncharacterized protein LOC9644681 [Selaginella moellendorffii]|uniref:uncharacterized protein LOC9644681 n=1 Tax=Selaginella moellendorffii TaxID=88036 RepID=UPI000D1CE9DC|nr:uncharacterized protein LOC9644681 [Selaginella moellendorffii]|eukprot:XP_024544713.1 uncharacterized protein LOC9644681 [Selaginella moellendorffii]